jgi:hypothetical protein
MREPSSSLFGAFYRASGEDRATEVLATVLQRSPELANAFAALADLPPARRHEVRTQVFTNKKDRVDLELRGFATDDTPLWLLWAEHKTHTTFHTAQLQRYRKCLKKLEDVGDKRLVAILLRPANQAERDEATRADATLHTWNDLYLAARRLPHDGHGVVAEWMQFSDNELGASVAEPLTPGRVDIVAEASVLWDTLADLTEQTMRKACSMLGLPNPRVTDGYWSAPAVTGLAAEQGFRFYIQESIEGELVDEPSFKLGVYCLGEPADELIADDTLIAALRAEGLGVYPDGTRHQAEFDIWTEISMKDVATLDTIEAQRELLATRAISLFKRVIDGLKP